MRQALIAMMVYLMIFGVLVIISLASLLRGVPLLNIGLPAELIDGLVLALSLAGLLKSTWHIHRIQL